MTIARICQRDVDTAEVHENVRAAAQRMASRAVGMLLVLDGQRRPGRLAFWPPHSRNP